MTSRPARTATTVIAMEAFALMREELRHVLALNSDLLAALRELVRAWDATSFPISTRMEMALKDADAAIARAEGRSTP